MWIKYKHRFGYGEDKDWKYIEVPDDWEEWGYGIDDYDELPSLDERLGEFLTNETEITDQYDYSEQYRGFKFEILDGFPPLEEIQRRLHRAKGSVKHHKALVVKYQNMLDQSGELKREDFEL